MKIGIFDSGLGGLIVAQSVMAALPGYDYIYLGDTARVPYGNRSQETIYQFTREAVDFLFARNCKLVIIACNTASAEALRHIQQDYLPAHYPDRRILGVLIPTAEEAVAATKNKAISVLATASTVRSQAFVYEIGKLDPSITVVQQAAPLLVPLVENDGAKWAGPILDDYLAPILAAKIDTLILGCTHYPYFKNLIAEKAGPGVRVISQDEIIPQKLEDYLARHGKIETALSHGGTRAFLATDLTENLKILSEKLFGTPVEWQKAVLP